MRACRTTIAMCVLLAISQYALATDYNDDEQVADASAEDAVAGLDTKDEKRAPTRQIFKHALDNAPPFFRDTKGTFKIRTFDLGRDLGDSPIREALAAGFELGLQSGKWRDALSYQLSWHTSYGIDAPPGLGNTGVLQPDQSDISVLSRAFVQWDVNDTSRIRVYRQDFNLPYINRQDSRMIPNTYEALAYTYFGDRLDAIVGYVSKVKRVDSERFVPMGERAGVAGSDAGTAMIGAQYKWPNGVKLSSILQQTDDIFATNHADISYRRSLSENWGLQLGAQLTNQWSVGNELLGDFDTHMVGLRSKFSYRGAIFTLAGTRTGDLPIRSPFGGNPSYTKPMVGKADNAREHAVRLGYSHNFTPLGIEGISFNAKYTRSWNGLSPVGTALGSRDEFDLTVDWRPETGFLAGLWLRVRWGRWNRGEGIPDTSEYRVILNYTMSAFE